MSVSGLWTCGRTAIFFAEFLDQTKSLVTGRSRMSNRSYRSSRPDKWTAPRPYQDESLRRQKHGRLRPMEEPGLFSRLFGR